MKIRLTQPQVALEACELHQSPWRGLVELRLTEGGLSLSLVNMDQVEKSVNLDQCTVESHHVV